MEELKPCPFCGGNAKIERSPFEFFDYFGSKVVCEKCESGTRFFPIDDWAITIWNNRGELSSRMKLKAKEIQKIVDIVSKSSPLPMKERCEFVEGLSKEQIYCLAMVMADNRGCGVFGGTAAGEWDTVGLVKAKIYDFGGFSNEDLTEV